MVGLEEKTPGRKRIHELGHQVRAVPVVSILADIVMLIFGALYGFSPPVILGLIIFTSILATHFILEHYFD